MTLPSPVTFAVHRSSHPTADLRNPDERPEILLIDDDPSVRESLHRVLTTEGLQVVTATGGRAALEYLSEKCPALIITDLCMAPLTGWDLIFHLQNHHSDVPIFVLTALPAKSAGGADLLATKFFQKPIDLDALLAAIRCQLDPSRAVNCSVPNQDTP